MGDYLNQLYLTTFKRTRLTVYEIVFSIIDLKARIDCDFYLKAKMPDKIVLGNTRCPFGEHVADRPSLCMMTSNVFGRIAAENLGYAKVEIEQAIARGHPECHIVIHLSHKSGEKAEGIEYFGRTSQ